MTGIVYEDDISIHAPSRERRSEPFAGCSIANFNPRSLAGATYLLLLHRKYCKYFNPRSLAGATLPTYGQIY